MKGKLLTILILSSVLFCWGCSDVHVFVQNNTLEDFRINRGGKYVAPGEEKFVFTLNGVFPSNSFLLCRSYDGCLARVTVTLEGEGGPLVKSDTITITEVATNTFNGTGGTWTSVSILHE